MIIKKHNHGFTLIELLVSVSIFSFLIAAVYTTFIVGNRSWLTSSEKVALQREVRWALFAMAKELRQAKDIFITNDIGSTEITFNRPSIGKVTYSLNSHGENANQLIREDEIRERVIAHNISYLTFTQYTTDSVIIEITATKKPVFGAELSMHLKEKVVLRL